MWGALTLVFNGFGLILLYQFIKYKIRDFRSETDSHKYWRFSRHKYVLSVGGMLLLAALIIEFFIPEVSPLKDAVNRMDLIQWTGVAIAFSISIIWAVYIRRLDIFEPESWWHILIVFIMGCVTVWLVYPISGFLNNQIGLNLDGGAFNDFMYCFVGIGMVEEFVKMIPLLIIMRFRNIVNEPYDYLLYAAISALGFAFIENSMYLFRTDLFAINARALMSSVAHMTFSSVIGYSYMISSTRRLRNGWYYILGGFLLASLMHGFFDFWLINPVAKQYNGMSFIFFILTTHFWFTMKNKAVNASYFFSDNIKLVNDSLRFFLIFWLVALLVGSTLVIGVFHGNIAAHEFLRGQVFAYGFLIYYLSFSFSRFVIAPRALAACQVVFDKAIPEEPEPREDWQAFYEEKEKHW
ncbi:MAG: PrsW family intramembrane metalloprotease [Flavobacteriales bacterium]